MDSARWLAAGHNVLLEQTWEARQELKRVAAMFGYDVYL